MYGQGLDSLAEDALASVTDAQPLLKLLVPLAGRRLRSFMEGITNKGEVLAILPTLTTSYIQSLVSITPILLTQEWYVSTFLVHYITVEPA